MRILISLRMLAILFPVFLPAGLLPGQTLVVNAADDRDDGSCDAAHCSLREAIAAANAGAGDDRITFDLRGPRPYLLRPEAPLPPLTGPGTIIEGPALGALILDGEALPRDGAADGLLIRGDRCAVYRLWVRNFPGAGIRVEGAQGARIGDGWPDAGNVLTGNDQGIAVAAGAASVLIRGNRCGLDPAGAVAPNRTGIALDGLEGGLREVMIGGDSPQEGNLVSGNDGSGIFGRGVAGLAVHSNVIGLNEAGDAKAANQFSGIDLSDCSGVRIGGGGRPGNLISGNGEFGVILRRVQSQEPADAVIAGNRIGPAGNGRDALPNSQGGIRLDGVGGVQIGGPADTDRNVISGNLGPGIAGANVDNIEISGNYIGADATGIDGLANGEDGIFFENGTIIDIFNNVVGGNIGNGLALAGCAQSTVSNNRIGLSAAADALGNRLSGVRLSNCQEVAVGGPAPELGNDIAFNADGVRLTAGASSCPIRRNRMFCNLQGIVLTEESNGDLPAPYDICVSADWVTGLAPAGAEVDVYIQPAESCFEQACQGRRYVGTAVAGPDGAWELTGSFAAGELVTATANSELQNTSEFSGCAPVQERPVATAGNPGPFCTGGGIELQGTADTLEGASFSWRGPGGYASTEQSPGDATQGGVYFLTVRRGICPSRPDSTLVELVAELEVVIGDEPEEMLCPGDSLVINGNVYDAARPRGTERRPAAGPEACDTLYRIDLRFFAPAEGRVDTTLCPGGAVTVNGTVYDALRPEGREVLPGAAAGGCDSVVLVTVRLAELTAEVDVEDETCPGAADGSLSLTAIAGGVEPYRYSFAGGDWREGLPARFADLEAGAYQLVLESAGGCRDTATYTVGGARRFLSLGEDRPLAYGDSLQLDPQLNFAPETLRWTPAAGLSCADCLRPVARPEGTTTYTLEATDTSGCTLTDAITLTVDRSRLAYVPNAFSPNGDGVNDRFFLFADAKSVRQVHSLRVFDRWGSLLFERYDIAPNDESAGWDGDWRGREAPQGVYVYFAEVVLNNGRVTQLTGEVNLLR